MYLDGGGVIASCDDDVYLDGGGVKAKEGENGAATIANDENVDDDKRKVRRVEIARRTVALRPILLDSSVITRLMDLDLVLNHNKINSISILLDR